MAAKNALLSGERDAQKIRGAMQSVIESTDLAQVDYISVAKPDTLEELETIEDRALLSLAVFVDRVRLIDNLVVEV